MENNIMNENSDYRNGEIHIYNHTRLCDFCTVQGCTGSQFCNGNGILGNWQIDI